MLSRVLSEIGDLQAFTADVSRIVETQEYAATTSLVDNLQEQSLLEEMLDKAKPDYREGTENRHYLISSPFRYPPLKHGSRFGDVTMPSFFYASEDVNTALAECAFYRFVFLKDMLVPYERAIQSAHMSFRVNIESTSAAILTEYSDHDIVNLLVSPNNYAYTQQLGKHLTQISGADVIRFYSARGVKWAGINVAIAQPHVIISKEPHGMVNWICHTTANNITFNTQQHTPVSFNIDSFFVDGHLPRLAP